MEDKFMSIIYGKKEGLYPMMQKEYK